MAPILSSIKVLYFEEGTNTSHFGFCKPFLFQLSFLNTKLNFYVTLMSSLKNIWRVTGQIPG